MNQNYPNPFNPSTTIEFQLPERAMVKITVYNMFGQEVETLAEGEKEAGYHQVIWNAQKYPSGVYWYKLNAGMFIQTKKMVLMK